MPVPKETARRVWAACLIGGGALIALMSGVLAVLFLAVPWVVRLGGHSQSAGGPSAREYVFAGIAAAAVMIGVVGVVAGIKLWPRRAE